MTTDARKPHYRLRGSACGVRLVCLPALIVITLATAAGLFGGTAGDDPKPLVIAVSIVLGLFVLACIRVPFLGVFLGGGEVAVRSWVRTHRYPHSAGAVCTSVGWRSWFNDGGGDPTVDLLRSLRFEGATSDGHPRSRTHPSAVASRRTSRTMAETINRYLASADTSPERAASFARGADAARAREDLRRHDAEHRGRH